jgi:hypothetical protein
MRRRSIFDSRRPQASAVYHVPAAAPKWSTLHNSWGHPPQSMTGMYHATFVREVAASNTCSMWVDVIRAFAVHASFRDRPRFEGEQESGYRRCSTIAPLIQQIAMSCPGRIEDAQPSEAIRPIVASSLSGVPVGPSRTFGSKKCRLARKRFDTKHHRSEIRGPVTTRQ